MKKSLLSAPKRLQRMLLRLQLTEVWAYSEGTEMLTADALSEVYPLSPMTMKIRRLECQWHKVTLTEVEAEYVIGRVCTNSSVTFPEIKAATETDTELESLTTVTKQGCPENLAALSPYLAFQLQSGTVISKCRCVQGWKNRGPKYNILRHCITGTIHSSHLGVQGCLWRAKEAFYWPGMYK